MKVKRSRLLKTWKLNLLTHWADLPDNDKPWRKPGTDISDYFNYGLDEFTWALYASKQDTIRSEYNPETVAANNKKMMDDFNIMMMGGMGMPGADGMPPELQQQMVAAGMDPSQMDPASLSAAFAAMQGAVGGGASAQGGQGGNFGQGGFDGNQGQGYGYGQGMAGGGGGGGGGGNRGGFGRGRGGRRNW